VGCAQQGAGMSTYSAAWYAGQSGGSLTAAEAIVPQAIELAAPTSVIDIGCGVGTWLSVFHRLGVGRIQGIDGPWVDRGQLRIPAERFATHDLAQPYASTQRFDLAMSVEVAEHLPESAADDFIATLAGLADAVLFSAAIPWQGGKGHVNERWADWWCARFRARGYLPLDAFRKEAWRDERVAWWYAQNLIFYATPAWFERHAARVTAYLDCHDTFVPRGPLLAAVAHDPLPLVHPAIFLSKATDLDRYKHPVSKALPRALKRLVRKR